MGAAVERRADEFLSFVTHPHAVARVLGPNDAVGFIESLAASPVLRFLGPTERHAEACAEVLALRDPATSGGLDRRSRPP